MIKRSNMRDNTLKHQTYFIRKEVKRYQQHVTTNTMNVDNTRLCINENKSSPRLFPISSQSSYIC